MKSFIAPSYTFTPGISGVGTVNLSGISAFNIKYLVSIINQTRGEIVYSTASASLRYTNVTGTTVTLFKDTSAMSSGDVLQVIYEVQSETLPTGAATEAKQDTGNTYLSSIDGKLIADGVVDAGNSSVTPLGSNAVFTGAAFEVTKYSAINVNVKSDVASATNGLKVEFSPDGTNWDHSHQTTYTGTTGVGYIFNAEFKFARIVYTNSTVAQSYFRLQTIFKTAPVTSSLYTLSQTVNANMFAQLNRSIITGETTGGGGGYVNVKVNPSGALTTESTVTGSVSVSNFPATQPISAAALPLPSGASTEAKQDTGNSSISSIDTKTPALVGGKVPVDTGLSQALTDTQLRASSVPVSLASSPLPSGASTEAKQDTGNTSLASIDSKSPALVSGKVPVDTGLSPLTDTQLRATAVPVSGTVTANTGLSQPLTDTQLRATPIEAITQNIVTKFRDAFEDYTPGDNWTERLGSNDLIHVDGNASGTSYLVISKCPLSADTESSITSDLQFSLPVELAVGLGMSQRTLGQEFSMEIVDSGTPLPDVPDLEIASISQATTILTVNTVLAHGLSVGKSIGIVGCSDSRLNFQALVVASVPSPTQFTVTGGPGGAIASLTITNPAGAKGFVFFRERLGRAQNGISQIFENATVTQSSLYIRSESGDALPSGVVAAAHPLTVGTTASVQLVNSPYQYAFAPTTEYRIFAQADRVQWADSAIDSVTQTTSRLLRTQVCPDPSVNYKFRVRAVNNKSLTVPAAQIVSAVKTGTTTATITTNVAHGLALGDLVTVYGIANQAATAFPNLLVATAVASIVSPTSFTIVIGTASTVTSYGGLVAKVQGGLLPSTLGYNAVVPVSATLSTLSDGTRQLLVTGNASWGGLVIGDGINLVGVRNTVNGTSLGVDGAWKVASVSAANLFLVPMPGNTPPADFTITNCGGAIIRRTEIRLSFVRIFDFERQRVEMLARPVGDMAAAMPVVLQGGSVAVSGNLTTVASVTSANLGIPGLVADIASAALTSTATFAPTSLAFGISYQVNIPVTVISGTNPILDVTIEESDDTGVNWFKVYDFPRITATGIYRSPVIPLTGNRIRYVQTVGGTTPSFTRAINRLQSNYPALPQRQLIDRTIVLTTLNSTTPILLTRDCGNATQLIINIGAATTAPQIQLEGSDDFGATWYDIGSALTAVANSTVQVTVGNINAAAVRARVSTAGVGVTMGYVMIKAHD